MNKTLYVYQNLSQILTLEKAHQKDGRHLKIDDLSIITNGSVIFNNEKILWVGNDSECENQILQIKSEPLYKNSSVQSYSLPHHILTPEIVDAHTHLVFGGDRSKEYALRLSGATYEEIAQMGGGILFTMKETLKLNHQELVNLGKSRVLQIASYGVGTIEIKSGYGLTYEKEKELSLIIHELKEFFQPQGINIKNTFMAAHAVPRQYSSSSDYLNQVVLPLLLDLGPQNILDAVDIFLEENYFTCDDVRELFQVAKSFSIACKMHADEFKSLGGVKLADEFKAISMDHLLQTPESDIKELAKLKTVAVLLPGTGFFLGKPQAPARKFLDAGVKVAIASDYNPGSCHCDNVILSASLAAPQYKIHLGEFWAALTLNAAHALGIMDQGALVPGLKPRFSLFEVDSHEQIPYNWGKNFARLLPHRKIRHD